jgi:hypothetical protein
MTDQQTKEAIKEAINDWMNEKFAQFGRWTFTTFAVIAFGWFVYGLITLSGGHR